MVVKKASKSRARPKIECTGCRKKQDARAVQGGNWGIPNGWKRPSETELLCKDCVKARYRLRAVTLPIVSVLEGGTWKEFCEVCRIAWRRSTDLANFAVQQLVIADKRRQPGDTVFNESDCYTMPTTDLYRHLKKGSREAYPGIADWNGAKKTASSILRSVEANYRKRRVEIVWFGHASPAVYRYPYPYPVHNQDWSAEYRNVTDPDGTTRTIPVVRVTIGGNWWVLRLRGGYNVRKHLAGFAHIVNGSAIRGELALYEVPASRGCHLRVRSKKAPGGGNRGATRLLVKMAAYLPNDRKARERDGVMVVRTGYRTFITAHLPEDNRPWVLKNNQVRGWICRHRQFLSDIGDDLKNERRKDKERHGIQERIDNACARHDNRIKTFVKTTAAHVAAYADRRKAARVVYHDHDRSYFPDRAEGRSGFPWAMLKKCIEDKLKEAGIEFEHVATPQEIVVDDVECDETASGGVVNRTLGTARGL